MLLCPDLFRVSLGNGVRPPELDEVTVDYGPDGRVVTCFCGEKLTRTIVPHLRQEHAEKWADWTETFTKLRGEGYQLKRIMRLFKAGDDKLLFSWTVIDRAIRRAVESGRLEYSPPPKRMVRRWQPEDFQLERTTVWDFPARGDWAVHVGDYRGNWPPQVPRNLIERYTSPGDLVVDAFVGGGTTLIEAWLLGRRSVGFDISRLAIATTRARLAEIEELASQVGGWRLDPQLRPAVVVASALRLRSALGRRNVAAGQAKLVCAHPPYLNSLEYGSNHRDDLVS